MTGDFTCNFLEGLVGQKSSLQWYFFDTGKKTFGPANLILNHKYNEIDELNP